MDGGARVLIVDDHVMLRESMRVALELAGNDVVGEAGDGNEALRLVEELHPSVVLMDVSLPAVPTASRSRGGSVHAIPSCASSW